MGLFNLLVLVLLLPSSSCTHHPASEQLTVQTSSGTISGTIDSAQPNVRQFLGIPFAQPPVGRLRWEPPQELDQSARKNHVNATQLPPSCPQYLTTTVDSLFKADVLEFNLQGLNVSGAVSEDCLTLSVWTPTLSPRQASKKNITGLPVFIFIYGGAWQNGGQDVPYQLPSQWIQRTKSHVVVSFNHRLNIFGFPNTPSVSRQNLGLLDQRLAVEWVSKNIHAFGGDPSRIVLWGQSSGASSIDMYNFAYPNNTLVNGFIMDSNTALVPLGSTDYTGENFSLVAAGLNCTTTAGVEQLACMRSIPFAAIEKFMQTYYDAGSSPILNFTPLPDNVTVFTDYIERGEAGLQSTLPAIIGTDAQEGSAFAPYPLANPDAGINATLSEELLLSAFICPDTESIRLRQFTGRSTYRYVYSGNFTNIAPRWWMGAYHSSELPMLFGTYNNFRGNGTELEAATCVAMQDAWLAFARDGEEGLKATGWNAYELGRGGVREFGAGVPASYTSLERLESLCDGAAAAS